MRQGCERTISSRNRCEVRHDAAAHRNEHDGAIEVAVHRDPQRERVCRVQRPVVRVCLSRKLLHRQSCGFERALFEAVNMCIGTVLTSRSSIASACCGKALC